MAGPYYVKATPSGNQLGGDEDNAMSLEDACDAVVAGDTVYVKADGPYTVEDGAGDCIWNPSTTGTVGAPILWQGYLTTEDDGGIVEIDADDVGLDYCVWATSGDIHYQVFKNFRFWGADSAGVESNGSDKWVMKNCSVHTIGGPGFKLDNTAKWENCIAYNCSAAGYDGDNDCFAFSCVSHQNTYSFHFQYGSVINSLGYNNSDDFFEITSVSAGIDVVIGCTIDGEGAEIGIEYLEGTKSYTLVAYNNIFRDVTTPINSAFDSGELQMIGRNLYDAKDGDNVNALAVSVGDGVGDRGDVDGTDANLFNGEAGDDYSLKAGSTALVKGLDAHYTVAFWADYNEGAGDNPPAE